MSGSIRVTFVMDIKAEAAEAVCASFEVMLPDTRAFPGCIAVNAYRSAEHPNRVILIEEWDSEEDYGKYLAWRSQDGSLDQMADFLAAPSQPQIWPIKLA